MLAHRLEHGNNIRVVGTRLDGAAIHEHRRTVEPRDADHAARHVLVAAAHRHQPVEPLTARDRLDGVGNDFARYQRILHALGTVGDAIGNGDGIEHDTLATGAIGPGTGFVRQRIDVHVARRDHAPGGGDADLRLVEILICKTHCAQHGASRCFFDAVHNKGRVVTFVFHSNTGLQQEYLPVRCRGKKGLPPARCVHATRYITGYTRNSIVAQRQAE